MLGHADHIMRSSKTEHATILASVTIGSQCENCSGASTTRLPSTMSQPSMSGFQASTNCLGSGNFSFNAERGPIEGVTLRDCGHSVP